jgi:two-component system sensor histidine kinase ChvG
LLDTLTPRGTQRIDFTARRLAEGGLSIKVLFRPAVAFGSFLLVASAPEDETGQGRGTMERLLSSGVLTSLDASCVGGRPLSLRLPGDDGEVLTYLAPYPRPAGCWVVVTAQPSGPLAERLLGRPYWRVPEIQAAALIYAVMALLVLSIFTDAWTNLRRFRAVARAVVAGENRGSFADANRVPDLAEVAREFDTMVMTLRRSEALIRQAAEENAHALKAPLAVIAQAVEPLRRDLPEDSAGLRRSVELIALSVDRLDTLVSTARRIDETIASLVDCPRQRVDLSALLSTLGQGFARFAEERGLSFELRILSGLVVIGGMEQIEIIAENLIDNAFDFSPPGGTVTLEVRRAGTMAEMVVSDQGTGIAEADLDTIFERYVSGRDGGAEHDGLGLWIVRRNAEAMGGRVWAANCPDGGLIVTVALPLAG